MDPGLAPGVFAWRGGGKRRGGNGTDRTKGTAMKKKGGTAEGYLWAGMAVLFWGVMFPVGRSLMARGVMEPSVLAAARFLLAAPLLLAAAWKAEGRGMLPKGVKEWAGVAWFGLEGAAMMALLLFKAQEEIPSLNASLLEAYVPLQVLAMGLVATRKVRWRQAASVLLGFVGSLLVLRALDGSGLRLGRLAAGDGLIFLSGLCWAVYTLWGRGLARRMGGLAFTAWTVLAGGLWLAAANWALGVDWRLPTAGEDWVRVFFLALFPTGLSFLGWNMAQKTVPVERLSYMEYFTLLVAALGGMLLLGEAVTGWQWAGVAVVILSAFWA